MASPLGGPLLPDIRSPTARSPFSARQTPTLAASRSVSSQASAREPPPAEPLTEARAQNPQGGNAPVLRAGEAGDSDSDEGPPMGTTQILYNQRIEIDDAAASFVMVFPRQTEDYGGSVDPDREVDEPKEAWEKIFGNHVEARRGDCAPEEFRHGPVRMGEYQKKVREKVLSILGESGFTVSAKPSIDGDEVFLKIALDTNGEMIGKLAHAFRYTMPLKQEHYKDSGPLGTFPGGRPMSNEEGVAVPLYTEYDPELKDECQPFRHIDEVRLIIKHLGSCMNLDEMQRQNVISRFFAGASYAMVEQLNTEWSGISNFFHVPDDKNDELIRDYFGEEVAFFFKWFALYCNYLGALGFAGMLTAIRWIPGFTQTQRDRVLCFFGVVLVVWETMFHKRVVASSKRAFQAWGMVDFAVLEDILPSYDAAAENTGQLALWRYVTSGILLAYVVLGCSAMWFLSFMNENSSSLTGMDAVLARVLSFVWRKFFAYRLVASENHRTQTRFNDALITNLAVVKLTMTLCAIFRPAFLKPFRHKQCAPTLGEAARLIYNATGWPSGVSMGDYDVAGTDPIPEDVLERWLKGSIKEIDGEPCVTQCFPVHCDSDPHPGDPFALSCKTSCMEELQKRMFSGTTVQILTVCINLVIPALLTHAEVRKEEKKARMQHEGEDLHYSFIQLQAKCHKVAKYEFGSWGGSYVEDFLDLLVTYALLAFFGICNPAMACIAFPCLVLTYRMLAYRMTNLTCRPKPRGIAGFGRIEDVMVLIGTWAPTCNVAIMVVQMLPFRTAPLFLRVVYFILIEKALMLGRMIISFLIPSDPDDVRLIGDYNEREKSSLKGHVVCPDQERVDYSDLDIGLRRRNFVMEKSPSPASDDSDEDDGCF